MKVLVSRLNFHVIVCTVCNFVWLVIRVLPSWRMSLFSLLISLQYFFFPFWIFDVLVMVATWQLLLLICGTIEQSCFIQVFIFHVVSPLYPNKFLFLLHECDFYLAVWSDSYLFYFKSNILTLLMKKLGFILHYFQEECKRVSTEGQNLRMDLSAKFQDAIKVWSLSLVYNTYDILNKVYIWYISTF